MPAFFTEDSRAQLDDLLLLICEELQLAPSRHQLAVQRYESVSRVFFSETYCARSDSPFLDNLREEAIAA